ncbi:MAG TPA: hypothetical protein GX510_03210 [Firmicutes bacterium]|nr:hypothetical protein [Candidatus Fermentithermobacillaceae bacterium]
MEQSGLPDHGSYQTPYDEIDLREYALMLWKWRGVVGAVTLGAVIVSGLLSFFVLHPVYEATVYLRCVQGDLKDFSPSQIINTQYFMARVINSMGLMGEYAPRDLMSIVTVREVPNTRMTQITVEHQDPSFASRLANGIAGQFEAELQRASEDAVKKASGGGEQARAKAEEELRQAYETRALLEARLAVIEVEVARLENMVASFKSSISNAELHRVELVKGLEELEAALAKTPKMLPGPPDWQGRPTEVPNETYQRLEEQIALSRAELAQVAAKIDELKKTIPGLEKELARWTDDLSQVTMEKAELDQRIKSLEEVVRDLSQRLAQYQASVPVVSIASPAMVPDRPVKPRKLLNMAVAGVLGFFVSVLWALVFESWVRPSRPDSRQSQGLGM